MNDRYLYRAKHSLNSRKWHIGIDFSQLLKAFDHLVEKK